MSVMVRVVRVKVRVRGNPALTLALTLTLLVDAYMDLSNLDERLNNEFGIRLDRRRVVTCKP